MSTVSDVLSLPSTGIAMGNAPEMVYCAQNNRKFFGMDSFRPKII
jgi:hypothetical protein